jgi:hypothetical protein
MTESDSPRILNSSRPFLLVWSIYSVAMLLGVWLLVYPSGLAERMDFRQLYTGGYLARTDPANLYDFERQMIVQGDLVGHAESLLPFNHPAYEAWLFAPLSRLSYRTAYFFFLCLNVLLLSACFFVCRDVFSRPGIIAQPRAGLQLFAFFPVTVAILQGQDSILFLLGLCIVYRCVVSSKRFLAGAVLALLLFKPQIALPLALFFAARYGFSVFAGFAMGGTIVAAASVGLVGWQAFLALGRVLLLTGLVSVSRSAPSGTLGVFPFVMPNLRGLISGVSGWLLPGKIILALTIALSVCVAVWAWQILKRARLEGDAAFSLATTAAIFLSYHLYIHDLSVMQIPLGLMGGCKHSYVSRATLLFYLAPPFLLIVWHNLLFLLALPVALFLYGISRDVQ